MTTIKRLFSRQWWWVTLIVMAGVVFLAWLGVWQLDRLQQRRDFNAMVYNRWTQEPYDVTAAVTTTDLNELEYVNGEIYANVWYSDPEVIARINPYTGRVVGWIDLDGLKPAGAGNVLNGIAYDAAGDRLFVTGKLAADPCCPIHVQPVDDAGNDYGQGRIIHRYVCVIKAVLELLFDKTGGDVTPLKFRMTDQGG